MQPVVMLLVSGVIMFSVIGGLSLLAHYYTLNGIKSKTVGDGQHGTARFATKKEIEETYVEVAYEPEKWRNGLSTLFQTNFFRLFFRYCTGV